MIAFRVDDMSCSHCVDVITKAVKGADARATLDFDLGQHLVRIEPARADAQQLREAIAEAGYTPLPVAP